MSEPRVVVITGATRGLGCAAAGKLAGLGHTIAGCGRNADHAAALTAELGEPHTVDAVDVTDAAAVADWAERVLDRHGPPDLLLNNAAQINEPARLWEVPTDAFTTLVDVNINGVFHVIRAFVPAMVERRAGVIVNFSSGWGRSTSPDVAPYCMSKWAIEGLSRALAQELPDGMACVPLNPGVIDTDMLRTAWSDGASGFQNAEQWAEAAVPYLLEIGPRDNGRPLSTP